MADSSASNEADTQIEHKWSIIKRARALAAVADPTSLDWLCHAAVLWVVIVCLRRSGFASQISYQPEQTTSMLVSHDSTGQHQLDLHSTVAKVDLKAATLTMQLDVRHSSRVDSTYCAAGGSGWRYQLVIGSAATDDADVVVPVCSAAEQHTITLPLHKVPRLYPYDGYVLNIRSAIRYTDPYSDAVRQTRGVGLNDARTGGPVIVWSGTWTAADMQLSIQRQAQSQAQMLLASAWEALDSTSAEPGNAVPEQLVSNMFGGQSSVVYRLELTRSFWCRIAYLTAVVLQIVAVGYCLMVLAGHVLCAVLMQQLLCNRAHSVWELS